MNRLYYLDHLRAFAMAFGILLHTTTLADFGWLEIVGPISHNFRMGTFFAVSGFFAAFLLERRSIPEFLKSRLTALGVPLIFGLVFLNPMTLVMIYNWRFEPAGLARILELIQISLDSDNKVEGNFVWHLHLWFLISLLSYVLLAPLLLKLSQGKFFQNCLLVSLMKVPDVLKPATISVIIGFVVIGFRSFFVFGLEPLGVPWIVRATLEYSPYYVLGFFLYGQPKLWDFLHRVDLPLILLVLALLALPTFEGILESIMSIFRRQVTICASLFGLLAIFRYFFSKPTWIGRIFSDGIYTAYMLHYAGIYALALLLKHLLPEGSSLQFFIIASAVLILTLWLHHFVLRGNIRILRFLLNGRWK